MRRLIAQIKEELEKAEHCAVYEQDLSRVWPDDGERRETQIAQFANRHGWRLRYYRVDLCAIFDREPPKCT